MKGQLKQLLMTCVGALALLALFGWNNSAAYVLLPTLPLLAALYAMHWVKGSAYSWWFRIAVPWTVASIGIVVLTPAEAGGVALKGIVSTISAVIFCLGTLAVIFKKSFVEQYRIAMAD